MSKQKIKMGAANIISKILCLTAVVFLFACPALAQPNVSLSAEVINNDHSVLFTFIQDDLASMDGCHYNLFAAEKASHLSTLPGHGLSIATFYRAASFIQIIAGPLPHLARLLGKKNPKIQRRAKVYFRVLLSCPEATNGMGDIISVTLNTYTNGTSKSVRDLRKSMKYHMRYYEP